MKQGRTQWFWSKLKVAIRAHDFSHFGPNAESASHHLEFCVHLTLHGEGNCAAEPSEWEIRFFELRNSICGIRFFFFRDFRNFRKFRKFAAKLHFPESKWISEFKIAIQSFSMRGIRIWAQNLHAEWLLHGNINLQNFGLHGDATSDFGSLISFLVWKIWTPNLCQTSRFYFL